MWSKICHVETFLHMINVSLFMLFCRKICFVAIYAILAQNLICRDLHAFVWRKVYSEIVHMEKKGQIWGMVSRAASLSTRKQFCISCTVMVAPKLLLRWFVSWNPKASLQVHTKSHIKSGDVHIVKKYFISDSTSTRWHFLTVKCFIVFVNIWSIVKTQHHWFSCDARCLSLIMSNPEKYNWDQGWPP